MGHKVAIKNLKLELIQIIFSDFDKLMSQEEKKGKRR